LNTNRYAGSGNWFSAQENRHEALATSHHSMISLFYGATEKLSKRDQFADARPASLVSIPILDVMVLTSKGYLASIINGL